MNEKFFPERMYDAGFHDLIPVIPPGAQLTPTSKIPPAHVGKVPGHRTTNGLWAGFDWRKLSASPSDVRQWCLDGASTGLRADRFPAVDIDCTDEQLAQVIEDAALAMLGPAPVRYGRRPKRILMYRTAEPFGRMRLWIEKRGEQHLVEVLGQGQQYLVHGIHPATMRPYEWTSDVTANGADALSCITREQADAFIVHLMSLLDMMSVGKVEREGDGRPITRVAGDQSALVAPSPAALAEAVELIPNTSDLFPDRQSYLRMGYAIRAAAGLDEEDGYHLFCQWAAKWEGNDRSPGNNPDVVREDWRRMKGPYSVGWNFIAEQARAFGFNDAALEFDVLGTEAPHDESELKATKGSDQWLSDKVVAARAGELRFVPQKGVWIVWNGSTWQPDEERLAEDRIYKELRKIADREVRNGVTEKEKALAIAEAIRIESADKAASVRRIMQTNRDIAVGAASLDLDPWIINTPSGIVDLKTGKLQAADPDALCTKATSVAPDFGGDCSGWMKFIHEATGDDEDTIAYLRRVCGYALTGITREETLTFVYGGGGTGKSTFLGVLSGILGDYCTNASMDVFTASNGDKHTTDLAMLAGARLVTSSETEAGKRWAESRVKQLTGGDPITARFMRQDNFTFMPQFKLVFIGNHKPELRHVGDDMKRRIQMVPFILKPKVVDSGLKERLKGEWPAIFAWMIEGCKEWQQKGLLPSAAVSALTEKYFTDEDAVGKWLAECTEAGDFTTRDAMFDSWREWANRNGEYVGNSKRLYGALADRGMTETRPTRDGKRERGYAGLRIIDRQGFGIVT